MEVAKGTGGAASELEPLNAVHISKDANMPIVLTSFVPCVYAGAFG